MIVHAELSCLTCGYHMGDVEGERGAPVGSFIFLPTHQGDRLVADRRGNVQCPRCGSRILPQGVTPVSRPMNPTQVFEADLHDSLTRGYIP